LLIAGGEPVAVGSCLGSWSAIIGSDEVIICRLNEEVV
jgi:hypothetical protein